MILHCTFRVIYLFAFSKMFPFFMKVSIIFTLLPLIQSFARKFPNPSDKEEMITTYPSWYYIGNTTTTTPSTVRIDGAFYPAALIGPVTHGPQPQFIKDTTLRINGELYNIKESGKLAPRGDIDSYLQDLGSNGDLSDLDDDTTPAPIQGAIDYVLLPLIFLAVTGPLLVIMYVVIASVESKLAPNVQLKEKRSLNNRKHTYFDLYAAYSEGAKPFMELVSRTMEHESCWERIACEVGSWAQSIRKRSPTLFDYVEGFTGMIVPDRFAKTYGAYMASARKKVACPSFTCFTIT